MQQLDENIWIVDGPERDPQRVIISHGEWFPTNGRKDSRLTWVL